VHDSSVHQHADGLHFVPVDPQAHESHLHPELGGESHVSTPHDHDH
jgi:hypothetical protein